MCLIVDACEAHKVFADPPKLAYAPVNEWLFSPTKNGCLVFGGKLFQELAVLEKGRRRLRELSRAGRALQYPDAALEIEIRAVNEIGHLSNDPHVLALARTSGARVICTCDHNLQQDIDNPRLISRPRGKVYQRAEHAHLLGHTNSCINKRKRFKSR